MKNSPIFKMLALATAAVAISACGTNASSNGTTDTTAGTDTTGGTDAVSTGGDTTTTTGDTVTGTDGTITTADTGSGGENMCTFTKPTTNPGCTSADDKAWLAAADAPGSKLGDNFGNIVSDCTLKQGCLAMGTQCADDKEKAIAKGKCIRDCIIKECGAIKDEDPASAKCGKMTGNCAWCYGEYSGECGFEKCLSVCAVDSSSTACRDCLKANCDTVRDACKDGK